MLWVFLTIQGFMAGGMPIILAIPVYLLFELGILMSRLFRPKPAEPEEEAAVK